jgi:hypothetical protein
LAAHLNHYWETVYPEKRDHGIAALITGNLLPVLVTCINAIPVKAHVTNSYDVLSCLLTDGFYIYITQVSDLHTPLSSAGTPLFYTLEQVCYSIHQEFQPENKQTTTKSRH